MYTRSVLLHILTVVSLSGCSILSKGDAQHAKDYLSCELFKKITVSMPSETLYKHDYGQCIPLTDPDDESAGGVAYYADAACQHEVDYKPTPFFSYCKNNLLNPANHDYIGNAAAWPDEGGARYSSIGKNSKWTLGHGPTLDVLALSPKGNHRPFMKQVEYRNVDGCHLEMRVYKKNILDQNLKPLMLIHGGAWKYRGFGAIGGEVLISHLTKRGFIVFEPYYRLMGSADGPAECQIHGSVNNTAPGEMIVSDIESALAWVKTHGSVLGAQSGTQVSLVGQSAGAHLADWLTSHHGSDISKALVFYTPADIKHYVLGLGSKYPWDHEGKELIQQFLGVQDLSTIQTNLPSFVVQNSFPELIRAGADFPPIFMIHGNADTLVPIEMSTRMCDALSNRNPATPMSREGGRFTCGTRRGVTNVLHVVAGANHILDLKCLFDPAIASALGDNFKDLGKLCPSGSPDTTEDVVKPAMLEGLDWLI